ncbi:MAG TPA: hypothetical protein VFV05_09435 [Methylomirabilota bacterium]|nr:hypothetical protein [Methylomirabilota bacterium]
MPKRMAAVVAGLVLSVLLAGAFAPAGAQDRPVRLDGLVQWVGGQTLVVQLNSGASVSVDLTRVPQDQYAVLTPREQVVVIGVIPPGGRRVIGTAVMRLEVQAP